MDEQLASLPSLPPEIQGKITGVLTIELGRLCWSAYPQDSLVFRLKFWGERTPGIILKSLDSPQESVSHLVTYSIKCPQPIFFQYLLDMAELSIEVLDSSWRVLGKVHISTANALNADQTSFQVERECAILSNGQEVGAVVVKGATQFFQASLTEEEPPVQVTDSFQLNELKAKSERLMRKLAQAAQEEERLVTPRSSFAPRQTELEFTLAITTMNLCGSRCRQVMLEYMLPTGEVYLVQPKTSYQNSISFDYKRSHSIPSDLTRTAAIKLLGFDEHGQHNLGQAWFDIAHTRNVYVLELYGSQLVGRLSIAIDTGEEQTSATHTPQKPTQEVPAVQSPKFFQPSQLTQDSPTKELVPQYVESVQAVQALQLNQSVQLRLYMHIETVLVIEGAPNLYMSYKSFPAYEKIVTPIFWEYANGTRVNHTMITPLTSDTDTLTKMKNSSIVIEAWNKATPDVLLGLTKVPLANCARSLESGMLETGPLIIIDGSLPILNLRSGTEVGQIKLTLATGTPSHIHDLNISKSSSVEPIREVSPRVSYSKDLLPEQELVPPKQTVVSKQAPEPVLESLESISAIAGFLNAKEDPETQPTPEQQDNDLHESIYKSPPLHIPKQDEELEVARSQTRSVVQTEEELIADLNDALVSSNTQFEEELRAADPFGYGYIHSERLMDLLASAKVAEPQRLVDYIVNNSEVSTYRRVLFTDILSNLRIPTNAKHTFSLAVTELMNCDLLRQLPPRTVYLKYLFPQERTWIESELLQDQATLSLDLEAYHSCVLPVNAPLSSLFSPQCSGIQFLLRQKVSRCEEVTLGKGLVPLEELTELSSGESCSRVICLYGDAGILGKLKLRLRYKQTLTSEPASVPLEPEPEQSVLSIHVAKVSELDRAIRQYSNIEQVSVRVSVFHESPELVAEHPPLVLARKEYAQEVKYQHRDQFNFELSDQILGYFKTRTTLCELLINQGKVIGTARIKLAALLDRSQVTGDFPFLNEYGQFMGCLTASLALGKEELQVSCPDNEEVPQPRLRTVPLRLSVEHAMDVPSRIDGEVPSLYVAFTWWDKQLYKTQPILRSSYPAWNAAFDLSIPSGVTHVSLEVWHKSFTKADIFVGTADVQLQPQTGWVFIEHAKQTVGKLKVSVQCPEGLLEDKPAPTLQSTDVEKTHGETRGEFHQETHDEQKHSVLSPKQDVPVKEELVMEQKPSIEPPPTVFQSRCASLMLDFERRVSEFARNLDAQEDDEILRRHQDNMRYLDSLCQGKMKPAEPVEIFESPVRPQVERADTPPSEPVIPLPPENFEDDLFLNADEILKTIQEASSFAVEKSLHNSPQKYEPEEQSLHQAKDHLRTPESVSAQVPVETLEPLHLSSSIEEFKRPAEAKRDSPLITTTSRLPSSASSTFRDSFQPTRFTPQRDISSLKTLKFTASPTESLRQSTSERELAPEPTGITRPSPRESGGRKSPFRRPPVPKGLLADPEISRIAAIFNTKHR